MSEGISYYDFFLGKFLAWRTIFFSVGRLLKQIPLLHYSARRPHCRSANTLLIIWDKSRHSQVHCSFCSSIFIQSIWFGIVCPIFRLFNQLVLVFFHSFRFLLRSYFIFFVLFIFRQKIFRFLFPNVVWCNDAKILDFNTTRNDRKKMVDQCVAYLSYLRRRNKMSDCSDRENLKN